MTPPLVLASGSPRRTDLLDLLGLPHRVDPARVSEEQLPGEPPREHVERLAREKALAVAARHPDALVLAGDTVVVRDDAILGKPATASEAVDMLLSLSGREHTVATGLALVSPRALRAGTFSRVDEAVVRFGPVDRTTAEAYVATGEPMDKAGAYGIQGQGAALVQRVEGDYHTVVGLPVSGLLALFREAGLRYLFGRGLTAVEDDRK